MAQDPLRDHLDYFQELGVDGMHPDAVWRSRAEGVRSLYGDFTIIQSGQPVIERLLNERAQVIQEDCRVASTAPEFHVMLKHYGDMRAQIVTPFIQGSNLIGVLSIHELRSTRAWKKDEMTLGADATKLLGQLALADLT